MLGKEKVGLHSSTRYQTFGGRVTVTALADGVDTITRYQTADGGIHPLSPAPVCLLRRR